MTMLHSTLGREPATRWMFNQFRRCYVVSKNILGNDADCRIVLVCPDGTEVPLQDFTHQESNPLLPPIVAYKPLSADERNALEQQRKVPDFRVRCSGPLE